jgi:DNA-binding response OmpR family regulator
MTADPRRSLRASAALREGATTREACRISGLSYGTVMRIRTDLRRCGLLPGRETPIPSEPRPPMRDLAPVARQLSAAILRAMSEKREEFSGAFVSPVALNLDPRKTAILALLMERAGRVVTRDEIHRIVYDDKFLHEKNLDVQINRLRGKLRGKLRAHGLSIATHWGVGYSVSREDRDRIAALDDAPIALPPLPCMARFAAP